MFTAATQAVEQVADVSAIPTIDLGEAVIRLVVAAALGAVLGLERQVHGRAAGLRTMMLVALGCCLIMLVSNSFAWIYGQVAGPAAMVLQVDPARLAYGVMGGIGFLGAGAILKSGFQIRGLTTAATIWCVAAIGLACGMGLYYPAVVTAGLVLFALFGLDYVESLFPSHYYKTVDVVLPDEPGIVERFAEKMRSRQPVVIQHVDIERRADGTLKACYRVRLPDQRYTLPLFEAVAREAEVQYFLVR